jgi:hypothetical protein
MNHTRARLLVHVVKLTVWDASIIRLAGKKMFDQVILRGRVERLVRIVLTPNGLYLRQPRSSPQVVLPSLPVPFVPFSLSSIG